jgi:hypothetical protein
MDDGILPFSMEIGFLDSNLLKSFSGDLPVHADMTEPPALNLIPLAGPRWKMADRDMQSGLVCKKRPLHI